MATKTLGDKVLLNRIRAKVNSGGNYSKMVDGVHTWDVAEIFTDFRAAIQIARRALKALEASNTNIEGHDGNHGD